MKEMRIAGSRGMQSGTESRIEQSRLNERERERESRDRDRKVWWW